MNKVRKMVMLALIISQALVLHLIEGFMPVVAPGIKLGLANIMTLVTLVLFGFKEALVVVIVRSVLGSLLAGSVTAMLYSLAGGILSCLVMGWLYFRWRAYFSMMGISTAGAIFHNIGQLLVASWVFGTIGILFTYLPVLTVAAVGTGFFVGLASRYIIKYLEEQKWFKWERG
ncbi:Gx transporter family protein [Caldicoprobacter algeriensis]|jgi:heptaprenyl diphosphate synthase|uniref:Gx transporter family protein n=1 Tax=Caldicoprobacter algeriensis TaxID=699281 RepID=UPI00207A894B|nr:Gx transporter family protein [Caldicoprobacter algeriensis]MCM8900970.1 Gx transporter family protein [Caldicoprobacter algeriensis]